MPLSLLLIGGMGQLGTEIRRQGGGDWDIVAPDRETLDMSRPETVAAAIREMRSAVILNASAFHVVDLCESRFDDALAINAVAVSVVAKAAADTGSRFVTVSTDYVFGGTSRTPYREDDPAHPIQCYGISKLAGERAALAAHPEGTVAVRSCGLYGYAPSRQKAGNFVLNRLADARSRDIVEVGSDLTCTPTSAADLASGILALLAFRPLAGLYHLTNSGQCDWAAFAAEAFRIAGVSSRVSPVDRGGCYAPACRPAWSVLSCQKAVEYGVVLRPWQDALADYVLGL